VQVLRHTTVERVVMVELDSELIDVSRRHLTYANGPFWDDPRATVT
jgi:spermidine synthase